VILAPRNGVLPERYASLVCGLGFWIRHRRR
jgi:hypothetical protein